MSHYIDGFVFSIPKEDVEQYRLVANDVATIWKEHGALSYLEYIGEHMYPEGTLVFPKLLNTQPNEAIVFGWVTFQSRTDRDRIHKLVAEDPRMPAIVAPLTQETKVIFDASKMVYGGFQLLVAH